MCDGNCREPLHSSLLLLFNPVAQHCLGTDTDCPISGGQVIDLLDTILAIVGGRF
jgi:hypothetical protein